MTRDEFEHLYMKGFSEQQRTAVFSTDGPVLLLAVPGGGKTTILVTRLGYMIKCCNVRPENILTLTYTVAATRDMARRYNQIFGPVDAPSSGFWPADNAAPEDVVPEFRTINGICAKIILYYGRLIGKQPFTLVTDEKYLLGLVSGIYRKLTDEFATESELRQIRTQITYIKNMMLSPEEIDALDQDADYPVSRIYREYCAQLRSQGQMDYDDQMTYALTMLRRSPQVLSHFQSMYTYVCVDEAQDTSRIQHEIIRLLASGRDNLFMVGDEDQSIYGFRAAYPQALLSFEKDHPGARVLLMEDNFRSASAIVRAADRYIQGNTLRHEKHMRCARAKDGEDADRTAGGTVREITLKGRGAQYSYLAKDADGCDRETAVLYRDNESVLPLVDLLDRKQIPFRIRSADLAFFTNRVVLDIENIFRFALQPDDPGLFMQIYYKLSTYLTKQAALQACELREERRMNLLDAALKNKKLSAGSAKSCKAVRTHLHQLRTETAGVALNRVVQYMGYGSYLERAGISDSKVYILKAIANREASVESFLQRMEALQALISDKENDPRCPFILSTIHSSKGLEYDTVYMMDVQDGLFPETVPDFLRKGGRTAGRGKLSGKADPAQQQELEIFEEQRRMFYVGVTRARDTLCLFRLPGETTFVSELMKGMPEADALRGASPGRPARTGRSGSGRQKVPGYTQAAAPASAAQDVQIDAEAFEAFCGSLGEGVLVRHPGFGRGIITELDRETVTVLFDSGEKKLNLRWVFMKGLLREDQG